MSQNYKVKQLRSANQLNGKSINKIVSDCGNRSATCRYVKMSIGNGMWEPVESWTIRKRVDGRMKIVDSQLSEKTAYDFVMYNKGDCYD